MNSLRPSAWVPVALASTLAAVAAAAALQAASPGAPGRQRLSEPAFGDPDDAVVRAAVALIADRVPSLPPIYATDPRRLQVPQPSNNTPAFRIYRGNYVCPPIFVNRRSITYKQAVGGDRCALKTLAAIVVHEAAHSVSMDDKFASRAELDALAALMREPTTGVSEQMCLMDRQAAVRRYAGLQ